jgi:hypothetical protein
MTNVNNINLNGVKYSTLQYTELNKQQIIDFVKANHFCLLNDASEIISFVDTFGDTIKIRIEDWVVIADEDNTESYVLDTDDYNKMFNLCQNNL